MRAEGNQVISFTRAINEYDIQTHKPDLIISYGYRHLINAFCLALIPRAINLHISYLPWNRGACPTFWSLVKDTPQGVTIHEIDEGVDTGPILVQEKVWLYSCNQLLDAINISKHRIEQLFIENWPALKAGSIEGVKQDLNEGSYQSMKDLDEWTRFAFVKDLVMMVDQLNASGDL